MLPHVYAANAVEKPRKLTIKEQRFCRELAIDNSNIARAARRAGYSLNSARQIGNELLTKPYIRSHIREIEEDYRKQAEITASEVLREMKFMAQSDIREIAIAEDGSIDWDETSPEVAKAIQTLDVERTNTKDGTRFRTRIKLYDKRQANVSLMTHLGLLSPELPPLEVLLNRLPPDVATMLRRLLAGPPPEERKRLREQQQAGLPVPSANGGACTPP